MPVFKFPPSPTRWCLPAVAALFALSSAWWSQAALGATDPEVVALKAQVQRLLQRIEQLEQTQNQLNAAQREIGEQQEVLAQTYDQTQNSQLLDWAKRTRLGAYGELHYNNLDSKEEIDFHRFVLTLGHQFNDKLSLFTELELEHAFTQDSNDGTGSGSPGEVELEQAFLQYDLGEYLGGHHRARGGVFLIPVGILNETHEPDTFYGVERNPVETNIIPSTWWEAGLALGGDLPAGLSYDLAVHSGLSVAPGGKVRGGRQKAAKANANRPAITGRLRYRPLPGLELAATVSHQTDITQDAASDDSAANLFEVHSVLERGPLSLRALYGQWRINGNSFDVTGRDRQKGWFLEPGWRLTPKLGLFARYSDWDNAAGDSVDSDFHQVDVGLNWWLHPNVVAKFDWMRMQSPTGTADDDGFNLGLGYSF